MRKSNEPTFCDNDLCQAEAVKEVPVSCDQPSDGTRHFCATCEEAYATGVQHGTITTKAQAARPRLDRFLKKGGFIVLTHNAGDPSAHGSFEAWAYQGPLNLEKARPIVFGVGQNVPEALDALNALLAPKSKWKKD